MQHTIADIEKLAGELDAVPPPDPRKATLSTREAVGNLAESISRMRSRGHTWESIAETMRAHGVPVTPDTLRKYHREAGGSVRKKRRGSPRTQKGRTPGTVTNRVWLRNTTPTRTDEDTIPGVESSS